MCVLTEATRKMLEDAYCHDSRHYHGMAHIENCFYYLNKYRALLTHDELSASDASAIKYMIWFHDVVYDTDHRLASGTNELCSSYVFSLTPEYGALNEEFRNLVCSGILQTARHASPDMLVDVPFAVKLFIDIDMSSLSTSYAEFLKDGENIRKEYDTVDDATFKAGRAKFFTRVLSREFIYHTPLVRAMSERSARDNMMRWLDENAN